jgi:DNA-binding response OmpR family regulator
MHATVLEASDGEMALTVARRELPDLMILDVMMPGKSGWEVCKDVRDDDLLKHTGVIMLTGIGEKLNEMTSPLIGADECVDKPFEFPELDFKVRKVLSDRRRQRDERAKPKASAKPKAGAKKAAAPAKKKAKK